MSNKVKDSHLEEKEQLVIKGTIFADEFRNRETGEEYSGGGGTPTNVYTKEETDSLLQNYAKVHTYEVGTELTTEILSAIKSGDVLKVGDYEFLVNNKTSDSPRKITGKIIGETSSSSFSAKVLNWTFGNNLSVTTDTMDQSVPIINGSPRGVYATVAALTSADPDHNYIYVVSADGHWYYWNGTQWSDGGAYQTTQVGAGSIGFIELDSQVNERLENLGIKGKTYEPTHFDGYVKYDDGEIASDNRMCYSDFIYIRSFRSLFASGVGGYSPISALSFYGKDKTYLKSISFNTNTSKYVILEGNEDYKDAYYCRISAYNNSQDYTDTYLKLYSRQDIDYLNLNGSSRRKLWKDFDKQSFNMTLTGLIYSSDGTLRNIGACTDFIKIGNRKKIYYNAHSVFGSDEYMLVAFYDKDKNYIPGIGITAATGSPASGDIDISGSQYDNAVYVRVSTADSNFLNKQACVLYPFDEITKENFSTELKTELFGDVLGRYQDVKYTITNPGLDFDSQGNITGSLNPSADRGLTDRISLSGFRKLVISTAYSGKNVWFYDANNTAVTYLEVPSKQVIIDIEELKETYPTIDNCIIAAFWGSEGNSPLYYAIGICKYNTTPLKKFNNKNLLIFGDSITDSCEITINSSNETTALSWRTVGGSSFQYRQMWAAILRNKYPWKEVRNYALSGATWTGEIANSRSNSASQVDIALKDKLNPNNVFNQADFTPDVVVFAFGANDGVTVGGDSYETAMSKTVLVTGSSYDIDVEATLNNLDKTKLYQAIRWSLLKIKNTYPLAQVYVSLPIQGAKFYPDEMSHSQLCEAIRKMAERCGCIVIDSTAQSGIIPEGNHYDPASVGQTLQDGLHPNAVGQKLLARSIASSLERHYIDLDTLN